MALESRSVTGRIGRQQFSGSNFSYQHVPLDSCFRDLAELGLKTVELWGIAPQLHVPWLTNEEARSIAADAASYGLTVNCLTPEQVIYPVNIASPDERLRRASIDMFLRAAELSVELGANRLFLTPGRGFENEDRESAWSRSVEALTRITSRAAELGVDCLLEPLQRVESNLLNTSVDTARMLADIGAPNLGVALDTVAMAVAGETVDQYFAHLGASVQHVHLIDGAPAGHLVWGEGNLPLREILDALGRNGYEGLLTVELFGDGTYALDPGTALRRAYAKIDEVLATL